MPHKVTDFSNKESESPVCYCDSNMRVWGRFIVPDVDCRYSAGSLLTLPENHLREKIHLDSVSLSPPLSPPLLSQQGFINRPTPLGADKPASASGVLGTGVCVTEPSSKAYH